MIDYCKENGIVRFEKIEVSFYSKALSRFWGLSDYSVLNKLHSDFLALDEKLSVNAMDFETISEHLITRGIVETTRAANTTAMYAIQWFHGHIFDLSKNQVRIHRARLRKIGIDIAQNVMFRNSLLLLSSKRERLKLCFKVCKTSFTKVN
ncbi:phage/plasmid replication domain-containing protein [Citrobacter koseri]|uniref:phage/plasmid replication domain-containing protein n=1 Tax=Citrobacter koseri TaxID=545 RepID=UPI000AAD6C63|nr:phage/plasmid replication protein [Citrobacter koseri]